MTQTVIHRLRRARDIRQSNLIGEPWLVNAVDAGIGVPSRNHLYEKYLPELARQRPDLVDEAKSLISYLGPELGSLGKERR